MDSIDFNQEAIDSSYRCKNAAEAQKEQMGIS